MSLKPKITVAYMFWYWFTIEGLSRRRLFYVIRRKLRNFFSPKHMLQSHHVINKLTRKK